MDGPILTRFYVIYLTDILSIKRNFYFLFDIIDIFHILFLAPFLLVTYRRLIGLRNLSNARIEHGHEVGIIHFKLLGIQ